MDLKKLFVYVPANSEQSFITNVIDTPQESTKYRNKIVFLEASSRIWVNGGFYGANPADLGTIWAALGTSPGSPISGSYTVGEQTFSYNDFTTWISALKSYSDAKIAAEKKEIADAYKAADSAIITAYQTADSAIITAYQKADTDLNNAYTAFKNKVGAIDSLPGTLKEYIDKNDASARTEVAVSGSGISLKKTTGTDGHDIYTITADQSIWEFMGVAWAKDVASVASVLDAKYPAARPSGKEVGDVWSVGIGGTEGKPATTILHAYDGTNWVQIGSAQGVSSVSTETSHGVKLTNTASVVGVNVTPGSIADGNDSVVTGGAVFTAISNEHDLAYAKIAAEKKEIVDAYRAADDALNTRINNLDATYTGSEQIGGNNLLTYNLTQVDGQITAAEVTFDKTVMHNYVADNLWEEYSA